MPQIGYARISTSYQDTALQLDALAAANCDRTFKDHALGARDDSPCLAQAIEYLRPGDTHIVWKLDRLGRSLSHLVKTIGELKAREIGFQSLTEAVDTTIPSGGLTFHFFAALYQFDRDLTAAVRGRNGGRKPVVTPDVLKRPKTLIKKDLSVREAAMHLRLSNQPSTPP